MSHTLTTTTSAEDLISLPPGILKLTSYVQELQPDKVRKCAELVIRYGTPGEVFRTQAEFMALAGNRFGFGNGGGYTAE